MSSPSPSRGEVRRGASYAHTYPHPSIKNFAKILRHNMTDAERRLWRLLRGKQLMVKFRKQHPIGPYVVDFVCLERWLIVELDGSQHAQEKNIAKDNVRTEFLESQGFAVLRFWNNDIFEQQETVLQAIYNIIHNSQDSPHPNPPPNGEGEESGAYEPGGGAPV